MRSGPTAITCWSSFHMQICTLGLCCVHFKLMGFFLNNSVYMFSEAVAHWAVRATVHHTSQLQFLTAVSCYSGKFTDSRWTAGTVTSCEFSPLFLDPTLHHCVVPTWCLYIPKSLHQCLSHYKTWHMALERANLPSMWCAFRKETSAEFSLSLWKTHKNSLSSWNKLCETCLSSCEVSIMDSQVIIFTHQSTNRQHQVEPLIMNRSYLHLRHR